MKLLWDNSAWEDYCSWQMRDKKTMKRINALIRDILRDPYHGIGKPEALRSKPGWRRRINEKDRLLYQINENGDIRVTSLCGHYDD